MPVPAAVVVVVASLVLSSPSCISADVLETSAVRSRTALERGFPASREDDPHFTKTAFLLLCYGSDSMPPTRNVDIKLLFDPTDMTPGAPGLRFRRDLLLNSGKTDSRGYSIADSFLLQDEGAVGAGGAPIAGMPVIPGGAAGNTARTAQRARQKEGFTLLTAHISDDNTRTILGNPLHPAFGRGDLAYQWVMSRIITAVTQSDSEDMVVDWHLTEIVSDIGIDENTVRTALVHLQVMSAEMLVPMSDEQIAVKLLTMIRNASSLLFTKAQDELNAVEGVPGQPGVRLFQLPATAGGEAR